MARVALRWLAAPVTPFDTVALKGLGRSKIGALSGLLNTEGVAGNGGLEGVAEVLRSSGGNLKAGDFVVPRRALDTWTHETETSPDNVVLLPKGINPQLGAVLPVTGLTALQIIKQYESKLKGGSLVINDAGSLFAQILTVLAQRRNIPVISVVPQSVSLFNAHASKSLAGKGVTVVEEGKFSGAQDALKSVPKPTVLVDSTGGNLVQEQFAALAPGGVLVSVGARSRYPITIDPSDLLENGKQIHGFSIANLIADSTPERYANLLQEVGAELTEAKAVFQVRPFSRDQSEQAVSAGRNTTVFGAPIIVYEPQRISLKAGSNGLATLSA